jgi:gamma-glutamyltranspeptidase/glutathione hydrolase
VRRPAPVLLLAAAFAACASFPDFDEAERWPTPAHGMVVSEHELATRAGALVLAAGGNAADAAVATALALAVVMPQAGNLGGGGFAVWVPHEVGEAPRVLDFREIAPRGLDAAALLRDGRRDPELALASPFAVGVPGSPAGLWELHARLGRLPFPRVAAPALGLARVGFPVDAALARDLADPDSRARLEQSEAARALFYPGGEPLGEGRILRQPELARTLERLARGPSGFYEGEVAESLAREMRRGGGVLDEVDLRRYSPIWREPLRGWFRGLEVVTVPPPGGGLVLLQILSVLDGFPLDEERQRALAERALELEPGATLEPDGAVGLSGRAVHWWIEAMRFAFADRARHLGDPAFVDVPVERLLSPAWIAERRVSIGELANPGAGPMPSAEPRASGETGEGGQTTHLSVLDEEGNALALTTTLNTSFGSGILVPGAGFLLNNEMDDFALAAEEPNVYGLVGSAANALAPGKRPLSSMCPTVIRDGGKVVRSVLGSPGGPRIPTALAQVLLRTEVYGQELADAVAAPRLHQQWRPSATLFEPGWDPLLLQDLRNRGHALEVVERTFGSVQAIRLVIGGEPLGASDPRRAGAALAPGASGGAP